MTETTERVGTVAQLWRHPAKSMMGEVLPTADLTTDGIVGDRAWAVRDEVRGGLQGAKKLGGLMKLSARFGREPTPEEPSQPLIITLPDGATVSSTAPDVNARLSEALDHQVTLWPLLPADQLEHYRRTPPDADDWEVELRAIFGRTEDEPLPDLSGFPSEIFTNETPPGTYMDAYPLLVMTTKSLETLQRLAPESQVDVRRFRPNIVVDVAAEQADDGGSASSDFPEQDWVGQQLTIGDVVLDIVGPCPRCVMITREFDDLPQDRSLMRTVVKDADQNLGVYARVVSTGRIAAGESVLLDS